MRTFTRILGVGFVMLAAACGTDAELAEQSDSSANLYHGSALPSEKTIDLSSKLVALEPTEGLTAIACPAGNVCIYQNSGRSGIGFPIPKGYQALNLKLSKCSSCTNGTHGNDGTFNDQMSSWQNNSGIRYCWSFDSNRGGEHHVMDNGYIVDVPARENDRASAVYPCSN